MPKRNRTRVFHSIDGNGPTGTAGPQPQQWGANPQVMIPPMPGRQQQMPVMNNQSSSVMGAQPYLPAQQQQQTYQTPITSWGQSQLPGGSENDSLLERLRVQMSKAFNGGVSWKSDIRIDVKKHYRLQSICMSNFEEPAKQLAKYVSDEA